MKDSNLSLAVNIIRTNLYAVIATANSSGNPWNSPVFICNDTGLNFYWASYPDAQHSLNILNNHKAFLVMFNSEQEWGRGQGLYMSGDADILEDEAEITKVCQLRSAKVSRNVQTAKDFIGESQRRIFKFTPKEIWVNNVAVKNGKIIDTKAPLKLADLAALLVDVGV